MSGQWADTMVWQGRHIGLPVRSFYVPLEGEGRFSYVVPSRASGTGGVRRCSSVADEGREIIEMAPLFLSKFPN
jgi:hypothetical protein